MSVPGSGSRAGSVAYWTVAAALTVFGFIDLIAIGAPFFLTGIAMLVVGRWRRRPTVLWPALVGVWAFVAGYVLLTPVGGCRTSPSMDPVTVCTYVFGIRGTRFGASTPSLLPALFMGLAVGAISGSLVHRLLVRRRRTVATR